MAYGFCVCCPRCERGGAESEEAVEAHKLEVRIGDAQFSAEGSEEAVKEQFDKFLDALRAVAPTRHAPPAPPPLNTLTPGRRAIELDDGGGENGKGGGLDKKLIERLFMLGDDGQLSLRVLPNGDERDADALVLLLLGYAVILDAISVTGMHLMKGARQSGVMIGRIDRVIDARQQYITKAGYKRGIRYGLNNPGMQYAETLARKVLG
jgi:hypothetical protein